MDQSRDETHDSIDPATGVLTGEAVARRQSIMERLGVGAWYEALVHPEFEAATTENEPDEPSTETEDVAAAEHVDEPEVPGSEQAATEGGLATEEQAVEAAEKPADGEAEPGSVQAASEAGFEAEVGAEAKADE